MNGKSYTNDAKVDIGKTATIDITKASYDSFFDGLKWENVGVLGGVYGTTKLNNNSSGSLMSIEFSPNRKMEAMPISVEDEIGQVKKIYISSAKFHFPDGAKIYISYDKSKWNTLDERVFLNNGQNYFRVGTSATDFVKSDTPVEWSKNQSTSTNYNGSFRALPSGDVSTYAISPNGYPDDYQAAYYFLSAKDDYGTVVSSKFVLKKSMNFNDGIWFRLQYAYLDKKSMTIKDKTLTYKFESGKDKYVELPYTDYHTVRCSCSPSESGSSAYYNHAEIFDFDESPYRVCTEKPACVSRVWTIKEQYARITFYDDYGNKKAFYIKRK